MKFLKRNKVSNNNEKNMVDEQSILKAVVKVDDEVQTEEGNLKRSCMAKGKTF